MFPSYYIIKNRYSQHVNKYQQKPLIFYQNTKELSTENWGKSQESSIFVQSNWLFIHRAIGKILDTRTVAVYNLC